MKELHQREGGENTDALEEFIISWEKWFHVHGVVLSTEAGKAGSVGFPLASEGEWDSIMWRMKRKIGQL